MQKKIEGSGSVTTEEVAENLRRDHLFRSDREFFIEASQEIRIALTETAATTTKPKPRVEVYHSGKTKRQVPGKLICTSDKPATNDADAKRALKGALGTWNFYHKVFGRNSVDNAGMILKQSVHYGKIYGNAFWNGRQMVYGDGNKKIYDSFTTDIDIIGHELSHGVVQYEANFAYEFQPGALNESCADVFGIMIKQFVLKEDVKKSSWLIGENIMVGNEYAIRSMIEPGKAFRNHPVFGDDPQPATMDQYVKLPISDDEGGVHYNSGIPNYAFYRAVMERGGFSWVEIGHVWYAALCDRTMVNDQTDFAGFKKATLHHARVLLGKGSLGYKAVAAGWKAAKV